MKLICSAGAIHRDTEALLSYSITYDTTVCFEDNAICVRLKNISSNICFYIYHNRKYGRIIPQYGSFMGVRCPVNYLLHTQS